MSGMLRPCYKNVARAGRPKRGHGTALDPHRAHLFRNSPGNARFSPLDDIQQRESPSYSDTMLDAFPKRRTEDPLHQGKRRGSAVRAFARGIIRRRRRRPTGKNLHRTRFFQTSAT